MTQPSTPTPTLQALIDRWREAVATPAEYSAPATRYDILRSLLADFERTLQAHPVVPLSELQAAFDAHEVGTLIAKYAPQPPNPHPQGTYFWAHHEHLAGKIVGRRELQPDGVVCFVSRCPRGGWDAAIFHHADFTATDWEVVS